jgi:diacylglycerol kinase family enzyme
LAVAAPAALSCAAVTVSSRRVAVLVNPWAQRASRAIVSWLRTHVPVDDLWITESVAEAQAAAAAIAARGYGAVAVGGGDGTFVQLATDLLALDVAPARLPVLVPLRLGTGNAISDVCESGPATREGIARDLARARSLTPATPLRLLEVGERLAHFAGVGLDADYAADYRWMVKDRLARGPLAPLVRGVPGLVLTASTMTVPRLVARPRRPMRIVALAPAERLDAEGRAVETIAAGAVLHEGPLTFASAATIWSYSHEMRFFPFADAIGDAFQLRLASANAFTVLTALPRAFSGRYANPSVMWDFACRAVRIELAAPRVFHAGGDVQPAAPAVEIVLSRRTVPVLRG